MTWLLDVNAEIIWPPWDSHEVNIDSHVHHGGHLQTWAVRVPRSSAEANWILNNLCGICTTWDRWMHSEVPFPQQLHHQEVPATSSNGIACMRSCNCLPHHQIHSLPRYPMPFSSLPARPTGTFQTLRRTHSRCKSICQVCTPLAPWSSASSVSRGFLKEFVSDRKWWIKLPPALLSNNFLASGGSQSQEMLNQSQMCTHLLSLFLRDRACYRWAAFRLTENLNRCHRAAPLWRRIAGLTRTPRNETNEIM